MQPPSNSPAPNPLTESWLLRVCRCLSPEDQLEVLELVMRKLLSINPDSDGTESAKLEPTLNWLIRQMPGIEPWDTLDSSFLLWMEDEFDLETIGWAIGGPDVDEDTISSLLGFVDYIISADQLETPWWDEADQELLRQSSGPENEEELADGDERPFDEHGLRPTARRVMREFIVDWRETTIDALERRARDGKSLTDQ